MNRRLFLVLVVAPLAGARSACGEFAAHTAVPLGVLNPWWNGQWSPFNPRRYDGSPGDPFILSFLWHCGGLRRVAQIGGKVFVDGRKIDLLSANDRAEFHGINLATQEAWRIVLSKQVCRSSYGRGSYADWS